MGGKKYIVLLTDFGVSLYPGIMNGVIKSINPETEIIDLSHNIPPQSVTQASFMLEASYRYFPHGSIFLCVVDPGVGSRRDILIVSTRQYFFIAPDNGLLTPVLKGNPGIRIFSAKNPEFFRKKISSTFHGRDIFAPLSAYLSKGIPPEKFGPEKKSFISLDLPEPVSEENTIRGEVIHIDSFGNLVSNIKSDDLENLGPPGNLKISFKDAVLKGLAGSYTDAKPGKPLALMDSFERLEIAVRNSSAKEMFNAAAGDRITIEIFG